MARTEVYTCDLCKQSKSNDDLSKLTVKAEGINIKGVGYSGLQIDICAACLKKKGFVVDPKLTEEEMEQAAEKNKLTLKDKIYEILIDLGVMFEE